MAGSNGFRRTKSFTGTEEKEAAQDFVHIAITYQSDGAITGYRNGHAYGKSYKTGKASFPKGNSLLSFGVRHLPAGPGRSLDGRIREVRIYDRALEPDAIMASFGGTSEYVSEKDLLAAFSPNEKKDRENIVAKIADLQKNLKAYDDPGGGNSPTGLHDLALALFNMKEFIYLK
jgi:hypothetical protein